jgi:tetratricopeptide (TPR) repeat protein
MNLRLAGRSVSAVLAALCLSLSVAMAQTAFPREQLQEMVGQLQKAPSDQALREKIIKLALTLDPPPAIPPEVERFMARGQAALETAKEPGDFKDAAAEFEKATLAAPWLGNAYCNLGIVQDKAGDYPAAIRNLKLYLIATPGASDAKAVETLLYKIEFKQEKAAKEAAAKAKESSPQTVAAKKAKADDDWLKKLDGARYVYLYSNPNASVVRTLDIHGNKVIGGVIVKWASEDAKRTTAWLRLIDVWQEGETFWGKEIPSSITGREFVIPNVMWSDGRRDIRATISEDGKTIVFRYWYDEEHVYRREK